jgi:hypothetical protein
MSLHHVELWVPDLAGSTRRYEVELAAGPP